MRPWAVAVVFAGNLPWFLLIPFALAMGAGLSVLSELDGEAVRGAMRELFEIEIGTAFGPLQGRIWRIGAMGYNAMKHKVLLTLAALESCLAMQGFKLPMGEAVPAAIAAWEDA